MSTPHHPATPYAWLLALALASTPLLAQAPACRDNPETPGSAMYQLIPTGGDYPTTEPCQGVHYCSDPLFGDGPYLTPDPPGCDPEAGPCGIDLHVPVHFPGNQQSPHTPTSGGSGLFIFKGRDPALCEPPHHCGDEAYCGSRAGGGTFSADSAEAVIPGDPVSCTNTEGDAHEDYSFMGWACLDSYCKRKEPLPGIDMTPWGIKGGLGCEPPLKGGCNGDSQCAACGAGGTNFGGGGPSWSGDGNLGTGPGAKLVYTAGGAGRMGSPGSRKLNGELPRYWMHTYATRIVPAPSPAHVWLVTELATHREFYDQDGDGLYERVSPTDEKRTLTFDPSSGWTLRELDGGTHRYNLNGRWLSSADRHGNAKTGSYGADGRLASVAFPDGRSETFTYHLGGRLAAITEIGVGGSPQRTWEYFYSGYDLAEILRPDGTRLEFTYGDRRHPGRLTLVKLQGTELHRRILQGWEYDAFGNVIRTWKGALAPTLADATEPWSFAYDNPEEPTETTVTDPLGKISVYSISRDPDSKKTRVTAIAGECPTCSLGPNAQRFYDDPVNPLLPTREINGRGVETQMEYDNHGQEIRQIEAVGTPEARVTEWEVHPTWPGLVTAIIGPAPLGTVASKRIEMDYDPLTGDLLRRREIGVEQPISGAPAVYTHETSFTYTAKGQIETIDPPGDGTLDVTSFTYDPARGGLVPLTRTDPLIGTTTFAHDGFNRRIGVWDVNGTLTETRYDPLNRVTSVLQRSDDASVPGSAILPNDIETRTTYSEYGDVERTTFPEGGNELRAYDAAGRLATIDLDSSLLGHQERRKLTYDAAGNRIREELQELAASWTTLWWEEYVYTSRCHLAKIIHADGSILEQEYDCNGNLARVWDENHPSNNGASPPTQSYGYDPLDRLTTLTQPWAGAGGGTAVTRYGYDVHDHLTSVTDAEGNVTSYTYSDRGVMTKEISPVSGTTRHAYSPKGDLKASLDARGTSSVRTLDAAGRVTLIDLPGTNVDTTFVYENAAVPESQGRLTRITRGTAVTDYRYDRYGRATQDGALQFLYTKNGDPSEIVYPGGVRALYTYLLPGRPRSLTLRRPDEPDLILADDATYRVGGLLASVKLGSYRENRTYTSRNLPASIRYTSVSNPLHWTYTTDGVGNITAITDQVNAANNRTFGYQDFTYFLTQATGPWATAATGGVSWAYDRIGNRLTETRAGLTDSYVYTLNPTGGRTALLDKVNLGSGGIKDYLFDEAGNLAQVAAAGNTVTFSTDAAGRLARIARPAAGVSTDLLYDGRDYLTATSGQAPAHAAASTAPSTAPRTGTPSGVPGVLIFADGFETGNTCGWSQTVGGSGLPPCGTPTLTSATPTYSSDGRLMHLSRSGLPEQIFYFYFYGRPIAQLERSGSDTVRRIVTDHLGTPILMAELGIGGVAWQGGFEPFGRDWREGTSGSATAKNLLLRLPGQWEDESWREAAEGAGVFYNVHRWFGPGTGRYTSSDPLEPYLVVAGEALSPYHYTKLNPLRSTDSLGLYSLDGSCNKWCGPPSPGQCSTDPAGQCVPGLIDEIRRRIAPLGPCRKALEDAGKWSDVWWALSPDRKIPIITCYAADCTGPGSSLGRHYDVLKRTPLCGNYFLGSSPIAGAQTLFHEILHAVRMHHGPEEEFILTTCFPGFAP